MRFYGGNEFLLLCTSCGITCEQCVKNSIRKMDEQKKKKRRILVKLKNILKTWRIVSKSKAVIFHAWNI